MKARIRILIVDDEIAANISKELRDGLGLGDSVDIVTCGCFDDVCLYLDGPLPKGVISLRADRPDLVFIDGHMKNESGYYYMFNDDGVPQRNSRNVSEAVKAPGYAAYAELRDAYYEDLERGGLYILALLREANADARNRAYNIIYSAKDELKTLLGVLGDLGLLRFFEKDNYIVRRGSDRNYLARHNKLRPLAHARFKKGKSLRVRIADNTNRDEMLTRKIRLGELSSEDEAEVKLWLEPGATAAELPYLIESIDQVGSRMFVTLRRNNEELRSTPVPEHVPKVIRDLETIGLHYSRTSLVERSRLKAAISSPEWHWDDPLSATEPRWTLRSLFPAYAGTGCLAADKGSRRNLLGRLRSIADLNWTYELGGVFRTGGYAVEHHDGPIQRKDEAGAHFASYYTLGPVAYRFSNVEGDKQRQRENFLQRTGLELRENTCYSDLVWDHHSQHSDSLQSSHIAVGYRVGKYGNLPTMDKDLEFLGITTAVGSFFASENGLPVCQGERPILALYPSDLDLGIVNDYLEEGTRKSMVRPAGVEINPWTLRRVLQYFTYGESSTFATADFYKGQVDITEGGEEVRGIRRFYRFLCVGDTEPWKQDILQGALRLNDRYRRLHTDLLYLHARAYIVSGEGWLDLAIADGHDPTTLERPDALVGAEKVVCALADKVGKALPASRFYVGYDVLAARIFDNSPSDMMEQAN
jgi:hypothetical protein